MEIIKYLQIVKLISLCFLFLILVTSEVSSQIYGISTKFLKPLDDILKELSSKEVIYIGEEHNNPEHIFIQLKIVEYLYNRNKKVAVGLEIFEKRVQKLVDSFIEGNISEKEFLRKTKISNYENYKPVIEYARKNKIKILAINADNRLVKKVSRKGFDSLNSDEKRNLPSLDLSDNNYKAWLEEIFKLHKNTRIKDFESFYYAQIIRDETMADTIAKFLQSHKNYQVVVISGKGHVIYGWGIPKRVLRRVSKLSYITLILQEEKITPGIGDYIIFKHL